MNYKSYLLEKNVNIFKNNILLFYGENLGLKNDFKKSLRKNSKARINTLTQEEVLKDETNFFEHLFNLSLFGEENVFFIEQVNDKILSLIQDLENKINNQKIFLFAEMLERKSKLRSYFEKSKKLGIVACYNDNEISLKNILMEHLRGYKGLNSENINIIINNSNLDRAKLVNEINKIKTFFTNKNIIDSELSELLNLNENDNFDVLKNAALSGNNSRTNKLLDNTFFSDDKSVFYLNSINHRLNKLNEILSMKETSIEESLASIKPPIFWKDKPSVLEQAKKWNTSKIRNILKQTFDLEINLKSNAIVGKEILIKKLLVDICNAANAS
tara:strand:- start:1517 stop:2503 length:987 start_codon:yes stop_codon:yes gene_type:complete